MHLAASDMSLSLTLSGLTTLSLCACNYIHVCTAALKTLQAAVFHLHRSACFVSNVRRLLRDTRQVRFCECGSFAFRLHAKVRVSFPVCVDASVHEDY